MSETVSPSQSSAASVRDYRVLTTFIDPGKSLNPPDSSDSEDTKTDSDPGNIQLCQWLDELSPACGKLYNSILYTVRQQYFYFLHTGQDGISASDPNLNSEIHQNAREVIANIEKIKARFLNDERRRADNRYKSLCKKKAQNNEPRPVKPEFKEPCLFLNYQFLYDYWKHYLKGSEDFKPIPAQTVQQIIKQVIQDFQNFLQAKKVWWNTHTMSDGQAYDLNHHPVPGRSPNPPDYKKAVKTSIPFTNQSCTWDNNVLKFPKKHSLRMPWKPKDFGKLKQVSAVWFYDRWKICVTYETAASVSRDSVRKTEPSSESENENQAERPFHPCGMDLGITRTASLVHNGSSLIVDGRPLISWLQGYSKKMARLQSEYAVYLNSLERKKNTDPKAAKQLEAIVSSMPYGCGKKAGEEKNWTADNVPNTKRMTKMWRKRRLLLQDHMYKCVKRILAWCTENSITHIVVGLNREWKQEAKLGRSAQLFQQIPFTQLVNILERKAAEQGICVIVREESYTSQSTWLDHDPIPTYGKKDAAVKFSGTRLDQRGLYVSREGYIVHSDLQGAANILRKEYPDYEMTPDFLTHVETISVYPIDRQNPTIRSEIRRICQVGSPHELRKMERTAARKKYRKPDSKKRGIQKETEQRRRQAAETNQNQPACTKPVQNRLKETVKACIKFAAEKVSANAVGGLMVVPVSGKLRAQKIVF